MFLLIEQNDKKKLALIPVRQLLYSLSSLEGIQECLVEVLNLSGGSPGMVPSIDPTPLYCPVNAQKPLWRVSRYGMELRGSKTCKRMS